MSRLGVALAILCVSCHPGPRRLTPAEASKPLAQDPPPRTAELDSRRGFGALEAGHGDAEVRAYALRFVGFLADENVGQLRIMLGKATWQPGLAKSTPIDELTRRFAALDYGALRLPLAQGAFDAMQLRSVDPTTWDVRLPQIGTSEPLFTGRPVLRVAREGDALTVVAYGEE